jgi:alpha-amylase
MLKRFTVKRRWVALHIACASAVGSAPLVRAYDVSQPAILEDFENTYSTINNRISDIFSAGYGSVWFPPPSRADSGNTSVGYDVYDRFDLGSPGNPTLYGTQAGLQQAISSLHTMGGDAYIDLVWNHSGFENTGTTGFSASGGYPGLAITLQNTDPTKPGYNTRGYNDVDGDYHSAYDTSTTGERISGLDDIAQEKQYYFIRQPTVAGPNNIPPGTTPLNGRLANVPNPANAQFYPDTSTTPTTLNDPALGLTNIHRYQFNLANPMNGDPTLEDDQDYLQRYAQWLVQVIGADGFRVDAAKNMDPSVLNYLDLAVYKASNRTLLNGAKEDVFSFSEVYDSSASLLQSYVLKNINPATPSTVGGDRDVLDFPLFFALGTNLSSSGAFGTGTNNWNNVVNASIDTNDDGKHNGSQGVMFVSSQDNGGPFLSNVAYAYTLMMPGNAIVYTNGHEFGTEAQRSFPQDGRGDALGGAYGDKITTLVDLRNRYGRGNYHQDWLEQNLFAFEREGSALILLSNTTDPGFDSRTIPVHFAPGTPLIELTGNAVSTFADPNNKISQVLVVNADSTSSTGASVNARFLRNSQTPTGGSTYSTGEGYLIYGVPTPTGTLSLTNVSKVLAGTVPDTSDSNIAFENGTDRISDIDVITTGTFQVSLATTESNLPGYGHDHPSDGDLALIKVDGGINVSGGTLYTDPTDDNYGFNTFVTTNNPGYYANNGAGGDGQYTQTINTAQLGQGYHYITVIAYRHNPDTTAAPVYNDWKQTIYIDTAPANSTAVSFNSTSGASANRTLIVQSVDQLANNIHVFLDLPFGDTDAQVLALIGSGNQPSVYDANLWSKNYTNVGSGNHSVTLVSYKPDGATTVQRYSSQQLPFLATSTSHGAGLGDVDFNGTYNTADISTFSTIVQSNNTQFNAAADINGDGYVDVIDTFLLGPVLTTANVDSSVISAYNTFTHGSYVTAQTYNVTGTNNIYDDTAAVTNVTPNAALLATDIRFGSLNIMPNASATIRTSTAPSSGVSKISSLTLAGSTGAWTGKLDLANNDLIVNSTSATRSSDLTRLTNMIKTAFSNGAWTGTGITSSAADADPLSLHTLGIIINDDGHGNPVFSTFDGLSTAVNDLLIKYTYYGDANLDGKIDGTDYSLIDNGVHHSLTGWSNGDFNYDGVVDGSDYSLIDNSFNQQSANPADIQMPAIATSLVAEPFNSTAVPEPTALTIFSITAAALLRTRRNRYPRVLVPN